MTIKKDQKQWENEILTNVANIRLIEGLKEHQKPIYNERKEHYWLLFY